MRLSERIIAGITACALTMCILTACGGGGGGGSNGGGSASGSGSSGSSSPSSSDSGSSSSSSDSSSDSSSSSSSTSPSAGVYVTTTTGTVSYTDSKIYKQIQSRFANSDTAELYMESTAYVFEYGSSSAAASRNVVYALELEENSAAEYTRFSDVKSPAKETIYITYQDDTEMSTVELDTAKKTMVQYEDQYVYPWAMTVEFPSKRSNSVLSKGTTKINGKEYYSETGHLGYSDQDVTAVYCFEGNSVKYIIYDWPGYEKIVVHKINVFTDTINESKITWPDDLDDYTVTTK